MTDQSYFQLIGPLIFLIFAIGFVSIWVFRHQIQSASLFAVSYFAGCVGFTLDFFRNEFSEVLASYLTNIPFLAVTVFFTAGMCVLFSVPIPKKRLAVLAGLTFALLVWFRHAQDDIVARTLVMNIGSGVIFTLGAVLINRKITRPIERILQILLLFTPLQMAVRMAVLVSTNPGNLTPETYATSAVGLSFQLLTSITALCTAAALFIVLGGQLVAILHKEAEERRELLKKQFVQFLSPDVVEQLIRTDAEAALAVENRSITVLVVDIRGFTAMSQRFGSERMVEVANHFFKIVTEEVFAARGTIDKYMGDSVMAFWNAPLDQNGHSATAVATAGRILERVARDNGVIEAVGLPGISVVAAIETGVCSVGNMGTVARVNYTALGPAVNMVARLEREAKSRDLPLVIGPECAARAGGDFEEVARVSLRGIGEDIPVFAPRG